jgi:hypothetical protein
MHRGLLAMSVELPRRWRETSRRSVRRTRGNAQTVSSPTPRLLVLTLCEPRRRFLLSRKRCPQAPAVAGRDLVPVPRQGARSRCWAGTQPQRAGPSAFGSSRCSWRHTRSRSRRESLSAATRSGQGWSIDCHPRRGAAVSVSGDRQRRKAAPWRDSHQNYSAVTDSRQ